MSNISEEIKKTVSENKVVLYMKGTPEMPQCGFSAKVVQILSQLGTIYISFDVLSDPELRAGIKEFSNWPTIPQLYVKKEFIGGCDIISEMFESGELLEMLNTKGIEVNPS